MVCERSRLRSILGIHISADGGLNMVERLVLPGEVVAVAEEFIAGEGTFEEDGKVLASYVGKLELDTKEMVARVKPLNPPVELNVGDTVLAVVTDIRNSMGVVKILKVEGVERSLSGPKEGSLHVSKISRGYTKDVRDEFRLGDIIRGKVIRVKPSLQISTVGREYGVLKALCTKCRLPLIQKDGALFCENCERTEKRKIAKDYGYPERV